MPFYNDLLRVSPVSPEVWLNYCESPCRTRDRAATCIKRCSPIICFAADNLRLKVRGELQNHFKRGVKFSKSAQSEAFCNYCTASTVRKQAIRRKIFHVSACYALHSRSLKYSNYSSAGRGETNVKKAQEPAR